MTSIWLDFHSIVTLWAPALPEAAAGALRKHFSPFECSAAEFPAAADIHILPLEQEQVQVGEPRERLGARGWYACEYGEQPALAKFRRGLPELAITCSGVFRIHFLPGRSAEQSLYGLVLQVLLLAVRSKGGLVMHGAVVERDGSGACILGACGSGKTPLLLTFLRRGWNYLGDDKFMLDGNSARLFDPTVALRSAHPVLMPWLLERLEGSNLTKPVRRLKGAVCSGLRHCVPTRAGAALQRRLDPPEHIHVQALVPGCEVVRQVDLHTTFILRRGRQLALQPLAAARAGPRLLSLHESLCGGLRLMPAMVNLCRGLVLANPRELLMQVAADVPVAELTVPRSLDVEAAFATMERCLGQEHDKRKAGRY